MYNIKQITNFDIKDLPEVTKTVIAGGDIGYDIHGYKKVKYKVISQSILKNKINKFGYCCEPKAIQYPIFLTINGKEVEVEPQGFQIGKTGMFELQPDTWKDINDFNSEEKEAEVFVTEIKVPWEWINESEDNKRQYGFNFKLDFIYSVN